MSKEKNVAQETNQPAKGGSNVKKTLSILGNIFIWLFIAFAVVVTVIAFAARTEDGVRSIGGKVVLTVQTPSMEPVFKAGDIIIGDRLDPAARLELQVGDIITFKTAEDINGNGLRDDLITHRIIGIIYDETGALDAYETKGDNNPGHDNDPIEWEYVVCKHSEKDRIPFLGAALDFLNTQTGFMICVVAPLILFFIFELISFIRKFSALKNEGKRQISAADEEEIRQRAVAEYLKAQAEKEAASKAAETKDATAKEAETGSDKATEEKSGDEDPEPPAEAKAEETPAAPVEEAPAEEKAEEAPAAPAEETTAEEKPAEDQAEEEKKPEA